MIMIAGLEKGACRLTPNELSNPVLA
jgi:hypothetical protein